MLRTKLMLLIIIFFNLCWAIWDIKVNKLGQWEVCLSNFGRFGQSMGGNAGAWWPRNSNHNYIFGAGIWIGTIAPNGDTLVTIGYDPHGGESECAPGLPYSNPHNLQWQVYFSTGLGYPFSPISFEDGYAIFNDFDPNQHVPNDTRPIGITVKLFTYVFSKSWADDVLFFKYIIKNDTTHTINNLYAGICMDYDIGNEAGFGNDRGGIDLPRKLFYGWQEQPEPGWDSRGMLGFKLLSPYPLTSFKRFTLSSEPYLDWQRYMVMAGYNFQNGNYEPFDTVWFPPDDQRILISTGTWNLAPGDSLILDWALIASHDSIPPSPEMEYKADKAQTMFDTGFHNVHIIQPNGGEIVSGNYPISYNVNPVTTNPISIDLFLLSEHGYDTIALNQPNTGIYTWNTTLFPDGVLNRILVGAYDTVTCGGDISDGFFTIDNPGNSPPYLEIISPKGGTAPDTLVRDFDITWFARDPEFGDSLLINIYYKWQYDTSFQAIAQNEPNDSHFIWNTLPLRNGAGTLILQTSDGEFTVADTVSVYLLNQISGGPIDTISGRNNCLDLSVLVHQPESLTGHTYELRFLQYRALNHSGSYYPEYIYEIRDLNTNAVVLDTYSLKDGYTFYGSKMKIMDFSPIIDGFSVEAFSHDWFSYQNFRNDSVEVIIGNYPGDSILLVGSSFYTWWAYRGSRLQLDWVLKQTGGMTLFVTDLDYGDTIPYKPYNRGGLNPDSAFGWCFVRLFPANSPPSDTFRPGYDNVIMLCGEVIRLAAQGTIPQIGEEWIVYPGGYSPPIKGNVYRFTPTNYLTENKSQIASINFNLYPVPCTKDLLINYSLFRMERIKLVIYDILGRQVKCLKDGFEKAGVHSILWNGEDEKKRNVSAGVYFCRLETADYKATKKIIFIR